MEWLQQNTLLGDEDLRIFRFKSGQCRIFELQRQNVRRASHVSTVCAADAFIGNLGTIRNAIYNIEVRGRLEDVASGGWCECPDKES